MRTSLFTPIEVGASDAVGLKDIELVMDLEDEFDIALPDERIFCSAEQLKLQDWSHIQDVTIGEIHSRVCEILKENGRAVPSDSWLRVQKRIVRIFDVRPGEIRPDTRLYTDLRASS